MLTPGTLICPLGVGVPAGVLGTGVLICKNGTAEQPAAMASITAKKIKMNGFFLIFHLRI
jgi:hypothetical protein